MQELIIRLTGVVNSSNFEEWKQSYKNFVQSINKDLVTDNDFFEASQHVKSFKKAENYLKEAKQSAINQAEDIQKLFSAIDEVSQEARQARLSLERQIKSQKLKIKQECIQFGIDRIQRYIAEQCIVEFNHLNQTFYLERGRFEAVAKGRTSKNGLTSAISRLCGEIENEIYSKNIEVKNNKSKIDDAAKKYPTLFPDLNYLISFKDNELDAEIKKRIASYEENIAPQKVQESGGPLVKNEDTENKIVSYNYELSRTVNEALSNKLNNSNDIFYYGKYWPKRTEPEKHSSSDLSKCIVDFKYSLNNLLRFQQNLNKLNLPEGVSICSVPGHESTKGATNLRILCLEYCRENDFEDLSCCLKRHKTVSKSSFGEAKRDKSKTLDSVSLVFEERLKDKVVVLIDDLAVTGNTLFACRDILKKSEVRDVFCFAFACAYVT